MALPNLPPQGSNPWYAPRTAWDNAVKAELEGRLSESTLDSTISEAVQEARPPVSIDLSPFIVPTLDFVGSRAAALGARTGLATTQYTVVAGDGVPASQGFVAENVATGVSGAAGSYSLTVTDTATLAILDGDGSKYWDASVQSSDGRAFNVTVLDVSGGSVTLAQPLPFAVSAGKLSSRMDALLGQHLTTTGTRALAQHIAETNPALATRGVIRQGSWDRLPPASRTVWVRNAALVTYGSVSSAAPVVVSNVFDQPGGNVYDATDLMQRPTNISNGPQFGTHVAGHGATSTLRTSRTPVVISFVTSAFRSTNSIATSRIRVVAKLIDGTVIYDRTVGGANMFWHQIYATNAETVTVDVTNEDGAIYYINLMNTTVRDAGVGTRLSSRKALLLGDSWTQFYDHLLGAELAKALDCEVATFGKGGTTTDWGIAWLDAALSANPGCDTVIVHFYTNDLNNNQSTTMTLPGGGTAAMWPNGLTTAQAEARWVSQVQKLVAMIQQRGLRPVVVLPGGVGVTTQAPASVHYEQPALADWSAATAEFTSATSYLNTVGKRPGISALNTTTGLPLWASGSVATDPWKDAAGTTAHTPV